MSKVMTLPRDLPSPPTPVRPQTIPGAAAESARRQPDRCAVEGSGSGFSYAELQAAAARVSAGLSVPAETIVAVAMHRRPESVAIMLGVLGAGATCLPVDPAYPAGRISAMLADSGCQLAIVDESLRSSFEDLDVVLDPEELLSRSVPQGEASATSAGPESLRRALLLYTSGSTGVPKGVMMTHANVLTMAIAEPVLRHRPDDDVAHVLSSSFDAVVLDVWGALINGATVHLGSDRVLDSVAELISEFDETPVSTLPLTSSLLHQIVTVRPEWLRKVSTVWCGGEAANVDAVKKVLAGGTSVVHHYGPAECTSIVTVHRATPDEPGDVLPIGRPVAGCSVHLLDDDLAEVPAGQTGSLYVSGAQVTRGILGDPRLTADLFVPHPLTGARMYRTGDLARQLPDGEYSFAGRSDRQVKIRGYRVEPADVTAALLQVPGVTDAAVVPRDDVVPGTRLLVAYLTGHAPSHAVAAALRATLPEYLCPARYVKLTELPYLPNHKLDAASLPAPSDDSGSAEVRPDAALADGDEVQVRLAVIWKELLGVQQVTGSDNFFALGGYSLLAARLMARIEGEFGARLPLRELFNARTLADLSSVVRTRVETSVAPAPGADSPAPVKLSPAQRELWVLSRLKPGASDYNSPIAFRAGAGLDLAALWKSVQDIAARHEVLRWRIRAERGRPVVEVADRLPDPGPPERIPDDSASAVDQWLAAERSRAFDLENGPLIRAAALQLSRGDRGPDDTVVIITVHHIVFDGMSRDIFLRELSECYTARVEGRPPRLPELPASFAEVTAREELTLESGALDAALQFWSTELAGAPTSLDLPFPPVDRSEAQPGSQLSTGHLGAERWTRVRDLARERSCTPFTLLLGSFALSLAALTSADDMVVACPDAGRSGADAEPLIGLFAHLLPVRLRPAPGLSVDTFLRESAAGVRSAVAGASVPFDRIVREAAPTRRRGARSPFTQIVFNLIDASQSQPVRLGDLPCGQLEVVGTESRVPLAVILRENASDLDLTVLTDPQAADERLGHRLSNVLIRAVDGLLDAAGAPGTTVGQLIHHLGQTAEDRP